MWLKLKCGIDKFKKKYPSSIYLKHNDNNISIQQIIICPAFDPQFVYIVIQMKKGQFVYDFNIMTKGHYIKKEGHYIKKERRILAYDKNILLICVKSPLHKGHFVTLKTQSEHNV
jgi:hypothetical protein